MFGDLIESLPEDDEKENLSTNDMAFIKYLLPDEAASAPVASAPVASAPAASAPVATDSRSVKSLIDSIKTDDPKTAIMTFSALYLAIAPIAFFARKKNINMYVCVFMQVVSVYVAIKLIQ